MWTKSHRSDPGARVIADRHYNRQKPGTPQFVPPGRCLVLKTEHAVWVTSWPFAEFVRHAWPGAWINSCFRREGGDHQASEMILAAVAATRAHWPEVPAIGMVTFVDPRKVRRKRDPGRCYLRAGFRYVGKTKGGLLAFQMLPEDMPEPDAALGSQGMFWRSGGDGDAPHDLLRRRHPVLEAGIARRTTDMHRGTP